MSDVRLRLWSMAGEEREDRHPVTGDVAKTCGTTGCRRCRVSPQELVLLMGPFDTSAKAQSGTQARTTTMVSLRGG